MAFLGEPHVSIKSECTVSWGSTPLPIQDYIASAVEAREIPSPHLPCSATGAISPRPGPPSLRPSLVPPRHCRSAPPSSRPPRSILRATCEIRWCRHARALACDKPRLASEAAAPPAPSPVPLPPRGAVSGRAQGGYSPSAFTATTRCHARTRRRRRATTRRPHPPHTSVHGLRCACDLFVQVHARAALVPAQAGPHGRGRRARGSGSGDREIIKQRAAGRGVFLSGALPRSAHPHARSSSLPTGGYVSRQANTEIAHTATFTHREKMQRPNSVDAPIVWDVRGYCKGAAR
jgi:hypothetical protein